MVVYLIQPHIRRSIILTF